MDGDAWPLLPTSERTHHFRGPRGRSGGGGLCGRWLLVCGSTVGGHLACKEPGRQAAEFGLDMQSESLD